MSDLGNETPRGLSSKRVARDERDVLVITKPDALQKMKQDRSLLTRLARALVVHSND
jgi:hypothetical protein